ncbi:MAG: hypothetical protein HYR96_12805 [Deltaproteobacteria bacterium]|nr:hypothetical protein [Deltaproteobacteria bacterium]MBI3294319.1 hypothetical protein [Deltaproteobacteria bacterium]
MVKRTKDAEVLTEAWDCVWIGLSGREEMRPLSGRLIQWIDWQMGGTVSRFVLSGEQAPVFVPTMARLPFPLICLDREPFAEASQLVDQMVKNGWAKVLVLTEDEKAAKVAEKTFGKASLNQLGVCVFDGV